MTIQNAWMFGFSPIYKPQNSILFLTFYGFKMLAVILVSDFLYPINVSILNQCGKEKQVKN